MASLHSPFQTNQGGMDAVGAGNLRDLRQLCVRYVPGVPVPFGTGGGTDGAVADGLNPVVQRILEQLGLCLLYTSRCV